VRIYPNARTGIRATAQTIKNGHYNSILRMLRAGKFTARQLASRTDELSTWGTGDGVLRVLGTSRVPIPQAKAPKFGASRPRAKASGGLTSSGFGQEQFKQVVAAHLMQSASALAQGQQPDPGSIFELAQLRSQIQAAETTFGPKPSKAAKGLPTMQDGGGPVGMGGPFGGKRSIWVDPFKFKSTHPTSGLEGYPAYDYMAPPGTVVRIKEPVRINRHSGKSPKLGGPAGGAMGYSLYAVGLKTGKKYYITHLAKVAKLGRYKAGAGIGVVAYGPPSWSSPHAHVGISG
jgi:hypothetical protein